MLEFFYCNRNIFLEGTFVVVTAGMKLQDFLELTLPAEKIVLLAQDVNFSSSVNFRRMCWFLNIAVLLRENSE